MKLGIIQGSTRIPANTPGVTAWANTHIARHYPGVELVSLTLHDLPNELDPLIPQAHPSSPPDTLAKSYAHPKVQGWSASISACDALLIVTPQYNWGIPAALKNSIDHLFWEWRNRPIGLLTFGGHGGVKCAAALHTVLEGGLKATVAPKGVEVDLPGDFIRTGARVKGDEEFLQQYAEPLTTLIEELLALVKQVESKPKA